MLRRRTARAGRSPLDDGLGITIRYAYPDDETALTRLAALDSKPLPDRPLLVAEVAGELWAAVGLTADREAVADPFRATAELVGLLRERAQRLEPSRTRRHVERHARLPGGRLRSAQPSSPRTHAD